MQILVADDHELLRDMLVMYLGQSPDLNVETADTFPAARNAVRNRRSDPFDLVLLDIFMPGMDGLRGLSEMLQLNGGQPVAVMSGQATRDLAERALAMGAAGFLTKSLSAKAFVAAVRQMIDGKVVTDLDDLSSGASNPGADDHKLSPREHQVLGHLVQGRTNKEIARALDIREPTVKLHVKAIYRKMGATNRTHAAMIARESGLF